MRLIYPGLVLVEDGDSELTIAKWLIENTTCPYKMFNTDQWPVTPKPGYLLQLGDQPYAILKWAYQYSEKRGEKTEEEKFGMLQAILYDTFGDSAKHIIARLAREAARGDMHNIEQFYKEIDITQADTLPEHPVSSTWGEEHVSPKE